MNGVLTEEKRAMHLAGKAIVVLLFANMALAQQNLWTTITTADGMISNKVYSIEESQDGTIWIGTDIGISYFVDGSWSALTIHDTTVNPPIFSILAARDGTLWIGTWGQLLKYENDVCTLVEEFPGYAILEIKETSDGMLWIGTGQITPSPAGDMLSGYVSRYKDDTWEALVHGYVYSIEVSRNGTVWIGTSYGLFQYRDNILTDLTSSLPGTLLEGLRALETNDGKLWVSIEEAILVYDNDAWLLALLELPGKVSSIFESTDGTLWFGTTNGLLQYRNGIWNTLTTEDGLASNRIFTIQESYDEALWFGTPDGISRYQEEVWKYFTFQDGLAHNAVATIKKTSDGSMWFGTAFRDGRTIIKWNGRGASRLKDGLWTTFRYSSLVPSLVSNIVFAIEESAYGSMWFGTWNGISLLQDGVWTSFMDSLNTVYAIIESEDGTIWFGADGGAKKYKDGSWGVIDNLMGKTIRSIFQSEDGALWFGSEYEGVYRLRNGAWTTYDKDKGLPTSNVHSIEGTRGNVVWVGTSEGLIRFVEDSWKMFTPSDGLASNNVETVFESSDGALWFGYGGNEFRGQGVTRFKNDNFITLSTIDGLINNGVRDIAQTADDKLWFATFGGVTRLRPDYHPPTTVINHGPDTLIGTAQPVFEVSGKDFRTEESRLVYSYCIVDNLKPQNNLEWHPFSTQNFIQTQPLVNGTYTFYVKAMDEWGNVDPTPAERTFVVDLTQPTVSFNSHKSGDMVSDDVVLIGNAFDASPIQDFERYELRYGFGSDRNNITQWKSDGFSNLSPREVFNDTLAIWETINLENGTYWLELSAWDTLGHRSEVFIDLHLVEAIQIVDSQNGSHIVLGDIEIYFPPNTITRDLPVHVQDCPVKTMEIQDDTMLTFANLCFKLTPENLALDKPATLSVGYPDSLAKNLVEQKLTLYHSVNGKNPGTGSAAPWMLSIIR